MKENIEKGGRESHLDVIKKTLKALKILRENQKRWDDSEVEGYEQSLAFKTSEALYCFVLPQVQCSEEFDNPFAYIKKEFFISDIKNLYNFIQKDGFNPNPYLFVGTPYQFTDFAAFLIRFLSDTLLLPKTLKDRSLISETKQIINKAFDFLEKSVQQSENGYSWAGSDLTELKSRNKKVIDYSNTYFTSSVIFAIAYFLKQPENTFSQRKKDKWEKFITQGGIWLNKTIKNGFYSSNLNYESTEINYTTYALKGIISSWDFQDKVVKENAIKVFQKYIECIKNDKDKRVVTTYFKVPLKGQKQPIFYEDRSTLGNVLTTLCLGKTLPDTEKFITDSSLLQSIFTDLMSERNVETKFWSKEFLVSSTFEAIEALIYFNKYGSTFEFSFTESEVREALRKTLSDPTFEYTFIKQLQQVSQGFKLKTIEQVMKKMEDQ